MNYIFTGKDLTEYLTNSPRKFHTAGLIGLFEALNENKDIKKVDVTYSANMVTFQCFSPNFKMTIGYDRIQWLNKDCPFYEYIFKMKEKLDKIYN